MEYVIGKKTNLRAADDLLYATEPLSESEGILYLGYPILATIDDPLELDALMTSERFGVVIFDFANGGLTADPEWWEARLEHQNRLYVAVVSQLMKHPALTSGRVLAVQVEVVTFVPVGSPVPNDRRLHVANRNTLMETLTAIGQRIPGPYLRPLNAAFQRVSTMRPSKKRQVTRRDSRGAVLKQIEEEIANLDVWQKGAAIESPEGPQRIRGLAGSGKTVVLALKAAYLHTANPSWTIGITFHTRALYDQFEDLVTRFTFEHSNNKPDFSKLRILHSWGSASSPGIYHEIASHYGARTRDFGSAKLMFGQNSAFKGVCDELLKAIESDPRPDPTVFDLILIDEAQDLPDSFFRLVYRVVRNPKRIVWAYDELQNLGSYSMKPPDELFGMDDEGRPLIELHAIPGQPRQDIILPVCYRNTPWALTVAHALGFGLYRSEGPVQFFDEPRLWRDIGYEILSGDMEPGSLVSIRRRADAAPEFFRRLIDDPADATQFHVFPTEDAQAAWVADRIEENIRNDELLPEDILVIYSNPVTVQSKATFLMQALRRKSIESHIAGVTTGPNALFRPGSVAMSGIFRAKGNEAPMVYVLDADYCHSGLELIKKRNILFTAITRSRAWVRVCGCGDQMQQLADEFGRVVRDDYHLRFRVPTEDQLARMRRIHRDMTAEDRKLTENSLSQLEELARRLERGDIAAESLPEDLRLRLRRLLSEGTEVGDQ